MKKWLSLALALCLCLALLPVTQADAYDRNCVNTIDLWELDYPITGYTADFGVLVAEGANYHVDTTVNGDGWINGIKWRHYASVDSMKPGDTFGYGTYLVFICIAPNEGCYYGKEEDLFATHMYGREGNCYFGNVEPEKGKLVVQYAFEATDKTFTVTASVTGPGNCGTITGAGTYYYGQTVTMQAYPAMGYTLYNWSALGDTPVGWQHEYTFQIMEDTVLFANFVEAPFKDICGTDFFYKPVVWAVEEEVTSGTSATTFSPYAPCTRAQAVTFLWRAMGSPEPVSSGKLFEDVEETAYYAKAVAWAVEKGITTGSGKTTFSPDDPCTRAQIVTFMWRLANKYDYGNTDMPFADVKTSDYFYDAVRYAVAADITTGTSETTFSPNDTCTRGQIVTFLWRGLTKG